MHTLSVTGRYQFSSDKTTHIKDRFDSLMLLTWIVLQTQHNHQYKDIIKFFALLEISMA